VTVSADVGDQLRWRVLATDEEDGIPDLLHQDSERLVLRIAAHEPKKVAYCAAACHDVGLGREVGVDIEACDDAWLDGVLGVARGIPVAEVIVVVLAELRGGRWWHPQRGFA